MSANSGAATDKVADALRSISGPIFAATWSEGKRGNALTVHASASGRRRELKSAITAVLGGLGIAEVKIRFHAASKLLAPRSLERLVERFAGDSIVYDPTSSLARAKSLVEASHAVRASLGDHVRGLYYAPSLRSFYVSLNSARVAVGDKLKVAELANIERAVLAAVGGAFATHLSDCPAVRVGFGLPASGLVAVDQRSTAGWNVRFLRAVRQYWKPITVAALFGLGSTAAARADQPAVADPNLKVNSTFGQVLDDYSWQVQGQFTAPIGNDFGIALEGGAAAIDGHEIYGAGGHLFTRDPDLYLLGIFGGYARSDDFNLEVTRVGAEGEFYLSQLSILATAGYQFSDGSMEDGAFGTIDLRWYITNNFYVQGGGSFEKDKAYARGAVEWQPGFAALPGLAFNVNGMWGSDDYRSIMGGLTYYFGVPASLKDRHRKYDPDSALAGLFQSVQQEQSRMCAAAYGAPTNC
jgi:hypothetical protein